MWQFQFQKAAKRDKHEIGRMEAIQESQFGGVIKQLG